MIRLTFQFKCQDVSIHFRYSNSLLATSLLSHDQNRNVYHETKEPVTRRTKVKACGVYEY
jgi:hypothetical protein